MKQPLVLAIAVAIATGGGLAGCTRDAPATAAAATATEAPVEDAAARAARLTTLYAEYWEELLKLNPVQATFQGDPRYILGGPFPGSDLAQERGLALPLYHELTAADQARVAARLLALLP